MATVGLRALLGTAPHFCEVVVLKLRTVPLSQVEATVGLAVALSDESCLAPSRAERLFRRALRVCPNHGASSSSLLLSRLELSDTKVISREYEPSSEPLHMSARWLFLHGARTPAPSGRDGS